ncbi:Thyrotropin receptor [Oryzias melastigma]|uniref:Thyrotropin receptor n=1 Tax=Oryzias melastigma TaxID=30732 RepID=A0A834BT30_ORYME|nr:Thyrotropin receptor [Oryzias melastigma]
MQSNRAKKHSNPNNMQSNRDCWTQWFDRDDPTATGDWETLSDLRNQFPDKVCPDPVDLEATTLSGTPADQTGEVFFKYDTTSGFVCRNEDQNGGMCKDYRVRFSCPSSYCTEKVCWTEWFDRDNPSGTGDWELLSDLRRENPGQICETPQYIQAKADSVLGVFKRDKFYIYNPTKGFVCRNKDQKFTDCWDYKVREIVENAFIHVIPANSFSGISEHALTVILSGNGMKKIESLAFNGSRLEEVDLSRNKDLGHLDDFAFSGVIGGPTHLDLSETRVSSLPPLGMEALEKLRAESVWALEVMPPFSAFPHLQRAELTFPSHCCGLQTLQRWRGRSQEVVCSLIRAALGMQQDSSAGSSQRSLSGGSEFTPHNNSQSCSTRGAFSSAERLLQDFDLSMCADTDSRPSCTPTPDALNPCEDVMSRAFLRVLVWVVSLVAISANLLVLLILLSCQQKLSVTRFLMGHLAFADGCMGTYLLLIASVDFYTRSHYHRYAVAWQTGSGCSLAGVLSVFASELSVYTLTSISVQRWHAIFNAMRPHRKMRLRHAAALMLIGWLLCITAAVLPLVGVNTYQRVSICLPMDTKSTAARAYLVSVLTANLVAFMVVCLCYLHIYCMVHNSQHASSRSDNSMAKRMAALIFTNFLCLAPVCFYGLSAAFNHPLMTFTDSKVLLVLFYPLNSCVHPFFYAILTKAFHRDTLMLLSRMGLCQRQAHLYRSRLFNVSPHIYRGSPPQ